MAVLTILEYPDPRLRTKAKPVAVVDARIRRLIEDMFETMYAAPGVGLAATQVDVHERVLVLDVSQERDQPLAFVNPEIVEREGVAEGEEGCLSVPGIFDLVDRAARIKVRALDREGKPFELEAEGLLAVCIQHEMDHLEGKLFVDYLSELKRSRIRKKLEKERRERSSGGSQRERSRVPVI
jgi:peptide deformylase